MDRRVEVVGWEGDETIVLEEGEGIELPARTPVRRRPKIVRPRPLPPGGPVRAVLLSTGGLAPIPESQLASLREGEPLILPVFSRTGAGRLDLSQLRAVAAQALELDRRLVIAAVDPPDE